jgi:DNA-binding response OmpR family regulator
MVSIVLVEDDLPIAQLVEVNLRKRGYAKVMTFSSLDEAKQWLGNEGGDSFDLAIVDMTLRDPNGELNPEAGITFCSLLRSDNRTQHIPIITTSAYADPEQELRLRELSNSHFSKPFKVKELLDAVDELLQQNKKGKETNDEPQGAD